MIEDGRAIADRERFAEHLEETAAAERGRCRPVVVEDDTDFSPDDFSFDFGGDLGADEEVDFPAVVETAKRYLRTSPATGSSSVFDAPSRLELRDSEISD